MITIMLKNKIGLIAIGNGTASETERLIADMIARWHSRMPPHRLLNKNIVPQYTIVNEAVIRVLHIRISGKSLAKTLIRSQ